MGANDGINKSLKNKAVKPASLEPKSKNQPYKVGDRIAKQYEIYRILGGEGESGMGIVYVCYDHEFKEVLALKTFQDKYLSSREMKDKFRKEAYAWVYLERHPFIVTARWVQELEYRMFVASELIAWDDQGRNTLTHHLKSRISLKQALTWSIQFCHGIEYAYSKGVTPHRDIKPDNIMITKDEMVKITDFGLAGLWDKSAMSEALVEPMKDDNRGLTLIKEAGERLVAGTPPWMAPEQFDGETDIRSDLYSFGVVMYQMINNGQLPFYPKNTDGWEKAQKSYPVAEINSGLFPLVDRCLKKKPEERYKKFDELRKDLERFYQQKITNRTGEEPPSPPGKVELDAWELSTKGLSFDNLGLHDEAITAYREALRINLEDAVTHNNLGNALAGKGLIDEAIAEYCEALCINPENALAHNNLGIALKHKGLIDEAIAEYREALRINPEYAAAFNNLGHVLEDKGLLDEAIAAYRDALRINPKLAEAHNSLGVALKNKGQLDEAIAAYREALRINSEYAPVYHNLGNALVDKGLLDEAIAAYRHALRINPEYAEAHNNLGVSLQVKDLLDEAIAEFREALRINIEHVEAHSNLGGALHAKGLFDEAIAECREALRINPVNAGAHSNLGLALVDKGLLDEAIEEFREALRINPEDAETHFILGIILKVKGLPDEAIEAFENFIKHAPPQYARQKESAKVIIREIKARG